MTSFLYVNQTNLPLSQSSTFHSISGSFAVSVPPTCSKPSLPPLLPPTCSAANLTKSSAFTFPVMALDITAHSVWRSLCTRLEGAGDGLLKVQAAFDKDRSSENYFSGSFEITGNIKFCWVMTQAAFASAQAT